MSLSMFLRDDGNDIIFTGHRLEIYIPESYTSGGIASIEGNVFKTFGILPCRVFDKNDKVLGEYTLNIPVDIALYFSDYEVKKYTFNSDPEPSNYAVIKYFTQEKIMSSFITKSSTNAELFMKLMCAGKIKGIPYDKISIAWLKNMELAGVGFGVTMLIYEIIISEVYRNKNNPDEKFSHYLAKNPKASMYDYRPSNMREICSRNSTFAALTFEDFDTMVTTSLNRTQYNKKQVESPIEKIIKM